jgi:hypothetical protein
MESRFGMESMARDAATARMVRAYEQEIQRAAHTEHLLALAAPPRAAWYCPILACIGMGLISAGTYLKTHYSLQPTLRAH